MAESNGNGNVLKGLIQLLLPALLAFGGSWVAVRVQLATLEERVAGIRAEMRIQNGYNREAHERYEQQDAQLAAALAERRKR